MKEFIINGDSMIPTLHSGDKVLINNLINPNIGDIVAFKINNLSNPIIHRVVKIFKNNIITCGDNKIICDRVIQSNLIIGIINTHNNKIPKFSIFVFVLRNIFIYLRYFLFRLGRVKK